jgi:hypothetical protein
MSCSIVTVADLSLQTGMSMGVQRFFSRGGKNFPGGGQAPTFCLKNNKKDTIFPKKSTNILFLAGLGRPGGQEPPLPSPADVHGYEVKKKQPRATTLQGHFIIVDVMFN